MHQFGQTRGARHHDHHLLTPETFVRAPLPGMRNATAIVHASPAGGALFIQYTVEFTGDGELPPTSDERFIYVLEGEVFIGGHTLTPTGFAYLPPGDETPVRSKGQARAEVFEKPYEALDDLEPPHILVGHERDCQPTCLGDDPDLEVRALIPDDPAFDLRVNTMTYQPGATLPGVEIHVMEHGLLMLEGGGIYRLNDHWYPVATGDVIWMAPYCPQWFGALGKTPAKYLIYKDWDRSPR